MRGCLVEAKGGQSGEELGDKFRQLGVVGQEKETARTNETDTLTSIIVRFEVQNPSWHFLYMH